MDFYEVLAKIIDILQRQGRTSYRALKRQFGVDEAYLDDLKLEIITVRQLAVDQDDEMLVWIGDPRPPESDVQHEVEAESRFHAMLRVMIVLLQHEKRVTHRELKHVFALDDALLDDIRTELGLRRLAIDDGEVLVWTDDTQPAVEFALPLSPETIAATSPVVQGRTPTIMTSDSQPDEAVSLPELARSAPEAERRQLTVMFCDLADSTKLSQRLDPEDLREVIRAYQATATDVIQQYDGHMAQYLGDGLLIYFGWPVAHEDDAQRAMHAGLDIVEAVTTTLNPRLEQEKGVQLTVRLGVHTGPVVVGEMGGGGRHENLATGETVNIAARLEGLAAPNTVIVSGVTARLVRGVFALEDLGPHELKGVSEPMQVSRVLGPMEAQEDEITVAGVPFLVGRDEEVGLLLRRWELSKEGLGQVALISGEAGIGKSSLVATLRHHVVEAGYTRITFRCSPYHANSALYPVIEHVQRVLQFQPVDTPETRLDKLEGVLKGYSRPLEEVVPLYAALLSVPVPEGCYPALNLSPQQQRQQTQDALVGWMLEEAERHPTLAMWEDLHWADPSTLEMLGLVLEQTPTVPMLHVLTFRPEFESPWATRSHLTPITLNRLERPQVEALIRHLAGGKTLPDEVVQHTVAKTDGVPLYVEELTKMLLESDLLQEEAEQYVLTGPLSSVTIPDTLQDSLMARLDQMHTAKEVAQLGSVLGREFPYEMLQSIWSQDEKTLQVGLSRLVEAELLYARGRLPRARYIFKHALIQDAAYQSLLRSTRQQVHQKVAQLLEARFPETVETQPELLAHHYTEAGLLEPAIGYWQQAGQRSIERSANAEAISHLNQGLLVLKTLPDTSEGIRHELNLLIGLGPALMATNGAAAPEVEHVYLRAHALCQQIENHVQLFSVIRGLWNFYLVRGDLQTAHELSAQSLSIGQHEPETTNVLEANWMLGVTLMFLGEFTRALEHLDQGMARHEVRYGTGPRALQDPRIGCFCYSAVALWCLGYPDKARMQSHQAMAMAQHLSHPYSVMWSQLFAAIVSSFHRDSYTTREQAEAGIAGAVEHGFRFFEKMGMILRNWTLAEQGVTEGIAQMRQGIKDYLDVHPLMSPKWLALLADAYGKAGQVEMGLTSLAEGLATVNKTGEHFYEAELHRLKGELLFQLSSDNATEAESCFHQALEVSRNQQAKSWELRAATSLARLWQSQDKRQDAYDLLAPVYEWFTEGFDTADLQEAKALLDELGG